MLNYLGLWEIISNLIKFVFTVTLFGSIFLYVFMLFPCTSLKTHSCRSSFSTVILKGVCFFMEQINHNFGRKFACQNLIIIIIIICHDFLPPSRMGSHVKSDYSRTIIKHSPLCPYTRHLRLDISSCAFHTVYPTASCNVIPPLYM